MRSLAVLAALATLATAQVNFTKPDLSKTLDLSNTMVYVEWTIDPANQTVANNSLAFDLSLDGPNNLNYKMFEFAHSGSGVFGVNWMTKDFHAVVNKTNQTFTSGKDYFFVLSFSDRAGVRASIQSSKFAVQGTQSAAYHLRAGLGGAMVAVLAGLAMGLL